MSNKSKSMQEFLQESYLSGENEAYLEDLYEKYLAHPQAVAVEWRKYFDHLLKMMPRPSAEVAHSAVQEQFLQRARQKQPMAVSSGSPAKEMAAYQDQQQERVLEFINAYRRLGHLRANIDPLHLSQWGDSASLTLEAYGLTEQDLNKTFNISNYPALNKPTATLADIYASLQQVYCGSIGFEYMHIDRMNEVAWIRERIEKIWANFAPTADEKRHLLDRLVVADGLEKYLGFKYVGQKRFSLEGSDALVPCLDTIINRASQNSVKEVIIGMAHRGRLNVLVNVVGKNPDKIFAAFEGKGISQTHSGDVKYHLGYSSNVMTPYGSIHLALAFNPSHLEIVAPVVQGSVRARQRRRRDTDQRQVVPIQIHGDAAFAAQGVVMETFSMSQARWFTVGGSIHIVINNQVGFTISNPKDARSTTYCTDVAKMVEPPILHVNGNDPEAVYFAAQFAFDYRDTFKRDVVIDLVSYRRHGHNEADEPSATQPLMYQVIKSMAPPFQLYAKQLVDEGIIEDQYEKKSVDAYRQSLDEAKQVVPLAHADDLYEFAVDWEKFVDKPWNTKANTGIPLAKLKDIAQQLEKLPQGFVVQAQVKKTLDAHVKMTSGEIPVNWGYAETMAFASLLAEGYPIRLCGQDSSRGTFAHRHDILYDQKTGQLYIPLSHISPNQAQINLVDSLLSEEGVLAFEYGYASAEPNYLVVWEAQYGDFANGAQVVIDQFISSGEQKWGRLCGLVMLLPHGYEGAGPEHTSARLERYLQLCAQDNLQVCVPSTASQIFHLLRRQMIRPYRKPLIVMTPKNLLRHPLTGSNLEELSKGEYRLLIPEIDKIDVKKVERLIICMGKVYYDLLQQRREAKLNHIAIVRIEQLYPFPKEECEHILKPYQHVKDIVWCQEEPQNQGAWAMLAPYLTSLLIKGQQLRFVGRPASASPAVGYHAVHEKEQKTLVALALKGKTT